MKIKKIKLKAFKRFHNLTIDLGSNPKKIIALVGPNGCGKSSIFDSFEQYSSPHKGFKGKLTEDFLSKSLYSSDISEKFDSNNAISIETDVLVSKKSFRIRNSYRFSGRLNVNSLNQKSNIEDDSNRPGSSIDLDSRLIENYERLFSNMISEFYRGDHTGNAIMEAILGQINKILSSVLEIRISTLGNITKPNEGKLFFEKGTSKKFPYDNLSSGEKEVIDLILDIIITKDSHNDTIYCIDEPELHLNAGIQRKLLIEIANIIPSNCQLWIATHSIGFLRALQDELKHDAQILDFSGKNFDSEVTLLPINPSRSQWQSIFSTALEDLTGLIAPRILIYSEGRKESGPANKEMGLDAIVYNKIFGSKYPDVHFVSSGGSTEPDKNSNFAIMVLSKAIKDLKILLLKDKDINNATETTDEDRERWLKEQPHHRMLRRKEIENYLFDLSVVIKAYPNIDAQQHKSIVGDCINDSVKETGSSLKDLCQVGNKMTVETFKKHLSGFITSDMDVYQELEKCIFNTEM